MHTQADFGALLCTGASKDYQSLPSCKVGSFRSKDAMSISRSAYRPELACAVRLDNVVFVNLHSNPLCTYLNDFFVISSAQPLLALPNLNNANIK
jgi:hypothetical protein